VRYGQLKVIEKKIQKNDVKGMKEESRGKNDDQF